MKQSTFRRNLTGPSKPRKYNSAQVFLKKPNGPPQSWQVHKITKTIILR